MLPIHIHSIHSIIMKTKLTIVGLFLSAGAVMAIPILNPDNGHYYDVIRAQGIEWNDALLAANVKFHQGLRGHLATISSAQEHSYVNAAIQAAGGGEMWAGGFQPVGETDPQANWTWVNNEGSFPGVNSSSPYAFWNGGEPNDFYGIASEQYLGLNLSAGFNDEGNLGLITGYVIEYDPNTIVINVPDGGSSAALLGISMAMFGAFRKWIKK